MGMMIFFEKEGQDQKDMMSEVRSACVFVASRSHEESSNTLDDLT